MTSSWKPDPAFVERFTRRRELFVASLVGATTTLTTVTCKPIDDAFTFGRSFEGNTSYSFLREGGIEYGLSYLRYMIDQGFDVAYAVSLMDGGTVHLQAWESPDQQRPWPTDREIVYQAVWRPMTVSRQ